ncbi:uncharacterized protein LOC116302904 [Actinia tenebrosa]|uniref:Uncharacterized protein LOC116302904 n=1 Tax=Actinia tenebrosa TaxID=6105 RepID=A0A6P8IP74_ACTTE|nr:uncharacterized protein LOC116302904 [Actinia tenebrosa]
MMDRSVGMFLLAVFAIKTAFATPDCLEPDTRVVGRWKNGNYYKGVVESLTNSLNVLFDNGNRLSYNLHSKYDVIEDRIPELHEIKWGDAVVVNRPHSFAFQPAHIREIVGGRYMVWYKDGSYIYQTKNDIRVFNKSAVCNEPAYLGCYRDQVPRYLTAFIPTRPATIASCVDMCNAQGYSIAALRNSDLCFCGNAYNKGYQTSDRRCDMPCYDNPYEKCGGVDVFSQYWTGIVGDKPVYRPSGLEAYTKFHLDPYGFQKTYQSVITKQSIPRFGMLPWRNILQARKAVNKPSSLAHSSPWRWNVLRSSWVRADGKQYRWTHHPALASKNAYRTWSSSQIPLTRNGWTWNGRAWVSGAKASTGLGLQQSPYHYLTRTNPFSRSTYSKPKSKPTYNKGYLHKTVKPKLTELRSYNTWRPQSVNILKSYSNVDISKDFTPNLVLQKLADRMRTVKWSQLSNFGQAFKPSSSIPLPFRYLGCFADDYQRDLPFQYSMPASSLSVRSCVLKCREHSFSVAGIQGSTQCFCGNTYSKYGRVREEECMMKCGSSRTDNCGGILRNSVYFTGIGSAWPHRKGIAANQSKKKTSNASSTHAQYKANDKSARKVTSALHAKFGKTTISSKTKVTKTVQQDSKLQPKKKERGKTQRNKNKARNKLNVIPEQLSEKFNSKIDDFQVESIKVKVNFSELKKALQTLSPEIVRRVQKDLSRMHKKEHKNHTREKVNVELEETQQSNNEEYDENDVERIRNEIHNKALNRLTNQNIKEILRILKIPKAELKDEDSGKNFEDAIKSIHAARKKGMARNGIKAVNGKDFAHEEIESYSRIFFDFPLKPTKEVSKPSTRKKAGIDMKKQKDHLNKKMKIKAQKKNTKDKSTTSIKVKPLRKVYSKEKHPTKMNANEKKINKDANQVTNTKPRKGGHLKENTSAKSTGSKEAQRLEVQSHKPSLKAKFSKLKTVAKTSDGSTERNKGKKTLSRTTKTGLPEKTVKESKMSSNDKPAIGGGNKKVKANNGVQNVVEVGTQPGVAAMKNAHSGDGDLKALLKMPPERKQISKGGDVKNAEGVKSVETGSTNRISRITKSSSKANSAAFPQLNQNKVKITHILPEQVGKDKGEKGQSSAKGSKESHEDKQNTANKLPENNDEKVKKSLSQSQANYNGVIELDGRAKQNDDEKSQNKTSEQKDNLKVNVENEGDENGVIFLGAAANQLQKSKKNDETTKDEQNIPDSKKVKKLKLVKETETENMSPGVSAAQKKEKKMKDDKNKTSMTKTSSDSGNDKKEQKEANTTTKQKAKNNLKKETKIKKKHKQDDSKKEQHKTKVLNDKNDKMSSKESEQKLTTGKKLKILNLNGVADLDPGKKDVGQSDKVLVAPNSVQMKKQRKLEASDSHPAEKQNDAALWDGGSGADTSGSNSDAPQTSFEQENKLLSFQKQNTIYGKSSNSALQKGSMSRGNSLEKVSSTKGKNEDGSQPDYSGMTEAEKTTESKIITKLNNLLNSGSGDDNFENVVNELEKNKIDGISGNGVTIMMGQGSGTNSSQENDEPGPQYSGRSSSMDGKTVQSGEEMMNRKMGRNPIGEDQNGNVGQATLDSNNKETRNLPTKAVGLNNEVDSGSGLENMNNSGELNSKYAYFGSGANKEELPLIRADDLKRLTQEQRRHSFENSGENPQPKKDLQGEPNGKEEKAKLHPNWTKQRLFVKSSIPKPPIYKMILIPRQSMSTNKKNGSKKVDGKLRNSNVILKKKASSKIKSRHGMFNSAKMVGQEKKKQLDQRKLVEGESRYQRGKKRSSISNKVKKTTRKGKYYSDVKGVRVVKNGVSFTVSKSPESPSQSSRLEKGKSNLTNGSSRNLGAPTNNSYLKNNKLKLHHISERRKKFPKKTAKISKTQSNKMAAGENEVSDDSQPNLKDNGSRNQLIWRGSRLNELNRKLEN